jgi:hypothetical protein
MTVHALAVLHIPAIALLSRDLPPFDQTLFKQIAVRTSETGVRNLAGDEEPWVSREDWIAWIMTRRKVLNNLSYRLSERDLADYRRSAVIEAGRLRPEGPVQRVAAVLDALAADGLHPGESRPGLYMAANPCAPHPDDLSYWLGSVIPLVRRYAPAEVPMLLFADIDGDEWYEARRRSRMAGSASYPLPPAPPPLPELPTSSAPALPAATRPELPPA